MTPLPDDALAAMEARAAAAVCPRCSGRGALYDSAPSGYMAAQRCAACGGAGRASSDVPTLIAEVRRLRAAVAAERLRCVRECMEVAAYYDVGGPDGITEAHRRRGALACLDGIDPTHELRDALAAPAVSP